MSKELLAVLLMIVALETGACLCLYVDGRKLQVYHDKTVSMLSQPMP